jgi:hypothetical protein
MNRPLVKINGAHRCPDGISRPKLAAEWDGDDIIIEASAPVLGVRNHSYRRQRLRQAMNSESGPMSTRSMGPAGV